MRITPGIIQTVLGNGQEGWDGDGGPALQAACQTPYMCAFDTQGNMFVCMGRHHRIRRMDATTGKLTPNDPPSTSVAPGSGPRHFAFHPNGKFAYVINEISLAVTAFRYDADRGVLTA